MTHARQLRWFAVPIFSAMAFILGLLCGCGGSGAQKVLYALGLDTPDVEIFSVSGSGTLVPSSSVSTGSAPKAMAIDPLARFAYILNSAGGSRAPGAVSQYVLNKNSGNLAAATFSTTNGTAPVATPVETGVNPSSVVVDSTGAFVFVANQGLSNAVPDSCLPPTNSPGACPSISVFSIDQVGGTLTEVPQVLQNVLPQQQCTANVPVPCPQFTPAPPTALATTGKTLFVAMGNGSVSTYTFDSTGHLAASAASTVAVGVSPAAMVMDASGKFLFVADSVANTVTTVSIGSSGQLAAVGAPVATGTTPVSVRIRPGSGFLYTANRDSDDISAFSIDSSGGLKPLSGSPFAVNRPGPSYVTTDSSGSLLFVAAAANPPTVSNTISVFTVDSNGALKQVSGSPFDSVVINPVALASIN